METHVFSRLMAAATTMSSVEVLMDRRPDDAIPHFIGGPVSGTAAAASVKNDPVEVAAPLVAACTDQTVLARIARDSRRTIRRAVVASPACPEDVAVQIHARAVTEEDPVTELAAMLAMPAEWLLARQEVLATLIPPMTGNWQEQQKRVTTARKLLPKVIRDEATFDQFLSSMYNADDVWRLLVEFALRGIVPCADLQAAFDETAPKYRHDLVKAVMRDRDVVLDLTLARVLCSWDDVKGFMPDRFGPITRDAWEIVLTDGPSWLLARCLHRRPPAGFIDRVLATRTDSEVLRKVVEMTHVPFEQRIAAYKRISVRHEKTSACGHLLDARSWPDDELVDLLAAGGTATVKYWLAHSHPLNLPTPALLARVLDIPALAGDPDRQDYLLNLGSITFLEREEQPMVNVMVEQVMSGLSGRTLHSLFANEQIAKDHQARSVHSHIARWIMKHVAGNGAALDLVLDKMPTWDDPFEQLAATMVAVAHADPSAAYTTQDSLLAV